MNDQPTPTVTVPVTAHPAPARPEPGATTEIGRILERAIDANSPIDTIERLVALHERFSERNAAAEFHAAMAAFQAECPSIEKTSRAKIQPKGGGGAYSYSYAELDQIANVTRPFLTKHGLSYSWDSETKGGMIDVVCKVSHIGGHSRTATFSCPTKPLTESMSPQQEVAAALTFARRQSLIQALGLTTCDTDNDGASTQKITEEQMMELEDTIKSLRLNDAERAAFLKYMGVASVAEILLADIGKARVSLKAKGRAK